MTEPFEKDAVLNRLAEDGNVAQFVSFAPDSRPQQRFVRIRNIDPSHRFRDLAEAASTILSSSAEHRVNVRTFRAGQTKGTEFIYGVRTAEEVVRHVSRLSDSGWFTIVNETVDVDDGGVSGVALGNTIEFAPGDTPRCVDKPGTCRLARPLAEHVLKIVYGFAPDVAAESRVRTEFSIHPLRRGLRNTHTIIWEREDSPTTVSDPVPYWPNRFSRFLGDKVFGLLIAEGVGCSVPFSSVIGRQFAPFSFGQSTNTGEFWLRTAPKKQAPGRLPSTRGWTDPFALVAKLGEDDAEMLAAVIGQEGVEACFSGAAACTQDGGYLVEGVRGDGSDFMLGERAPEQLPKAVHSDAIQTLKSLSEVCGPNRVEWVHDGQKLWVLQLHIGGIAKDRNVIFEGDADEWVDFRIVAGLESLRALISEVEGRRIGVRLLGDVGITSHFGDLLRQRAIPSEIIRE